ncbi:calcium-binding protein, partial [Parvibium lacunae]
MTTTINQAYINALLADASYVENLGNGQTGEILLNNRDLIGRMTLTQAKFIADNFTVVSAEDKPDAPFGSSFEGVVWRGNAGTDYAGQIYVSMRGSQQITDFLVDGDLATSGAARAQVLDMVNWWLRITTPAGQMAKQISEYNYGLTNTWAYVYTTSVPGEGLVPANATLNVNGHSLGGHLASAFARIFGGQADMASVNTFNSAGFLPGSESVFNKLQDLLGTGLPTYASNVQNNFFAQNGINVTTNTFWFNQIGQRISLFNEEGTGFPNHYMYKLTDALALANTLKKIDSSLTFTTLGTLFSQGENKTVASLEGVLDGLRKLILGLNITPTPISDAGDSPDRKTFFQNLQDLQNSSAFKALAGKLQIIATTANAESAKSDFGQFLSLYYLTPFTVSTPDAGSQAKLLLTQ